jgi:acetoacetate decarboxylase
MRTAVTQHASLSLTEKAGVGSVSKAGQKITYRFVVTNNGNLKMHHLELDATFSGAGKRSAFTYPTKRLAPGAKTTVRVTYTVAKGDIAAGKPIVSRSTATGRRLNTTGKPTTSNTSSARVAVK